MTEGNHKIEKRRRKFSNVYRVVEGDYAKWRSLNKERLFKSPHHKVNIGNKRIDVELKKDAEDYEDMLTSKGHTVTPDEFLDETKPGSIKIPVKNRDQFPPDKQLPSSELLKVLHYFTSKKFASDSRYQRIFDESALLALGMLVEQWVDDLIDEKAARMFMKRFEKETPFNEMEVLNESEGNENEEDEENDEEDEDQDDEDEEDEDDEQEDKGVEEEKNEDVEEDQDDDDDDDDDEGVVKREEDQDSE